MHKSTHVIRHSILDVIRLSENVKGLSMLFQKQFNISRQAINRHLNKLEKEGFLMSTGNTKNKIYSLGVNRKQTRRFAIDSSLEESEIYTNDFAWAVENAPPNIKEIVDYGFTEMLNNVIDHSQGKKCFIEININKEFIQICIADDGEGIFKRIKRLKGFSSQRQAILELSKGKLTTDQSNHTGEGVFFSSKIFSHFFIISGGHELEFYQSNKINFAANKAFESGTWVSMIIDISSKNTLKEIFDQFTHEPDFAFDRTIIPIRLAKSSEQTLLSRSQAKRVLNRLDEFKRVTFDFEGIDSIGQGFSDELFRVYPNKNPQIIFDYVNANIEVRKMIKRVKK